MTHRQCRPVRLDQYVIHDLRLIFEARLVFEEIRYFSLLVIVTFELSECPHQSGGKYVTSSGRLTIKFNVVACRICTRHSRKSSLEVIPTYKNSTYNQLAQ